MDDQRTNRERGGKYLQLTIKIPIPSRRWFRFSLKSLLVVMLFVALACAAWTIYKGSEHARSQQQLQAAKTARDITLQTWKVAASNNRKVGISATNNEPALRAQYFKDKDAVENALKRLAEHEG